MKSLFSEGRVTDNERDKKKNQNQIPKILIPHDRGSGLCAYDRSCDHFYEPRKYNSRIASEKAGAWG